MSTGIADITKSLADAYRCTQEILRKQEGEMWCGCMVPLMSVAWCVFETTVDDLCIAECRKCGATWDAWLARSHYYDTLLSSVGSYSP